MPTPGLVRLAAFALDELRIHPQAELSILLVDSDTMSAYHEKYLGESGPTDVLSFPMDELRPPGDGDEPPEGLLGDIVLCPEVTAQQAAEHRRYRDGGGGVPADPRLAAPARLRPRRGGRAGRDVRAQRQDHRRLGEAATRGARFPGTPTRGSGRSEPGRLDPARRRGGPGRAGRGDGGRGGRAVVVLRARAQRLVEDGRPGALRVQRIVADPPPYLNTALFLRTVFEILAIVLVRRGLRLSRRPGGGC